MDVLIETLVEIDRDLQSETPAVGDLWNLPTSTKDKETPRRPKGENDLSDWLKRRLGEKIKHRGILPMREVEIRRSAGRGGESSGERTDLYVTASVHGDLEGSFNTIWVIIEVKGCWHPHVKTALETQLIGRYLVDNECKHGIYVVGWFACDGWDDADPRKSATPKMSLDGARTFFQDQAGRASVGPQQVRSFVLNSALK